MFRRMEEIRIENVLGGSSNPPVNVQFFWTTNSDMVWPRANQENAMMWGALRRLGYQPGIIGDAAFESGAYSNAPVLLLSRCYEMAPQQLQELATRVLPAGIHVHANADLPGQLDPYSRPNPDWNGFMSSIFGLATANGFRGLHAIVTNDDWEEIDFQGARALSPLPSSYNMKVKSWEIWHNLGVTDGTTVVTDNGVNGSQPAGIPALVTKAHAAGWGKAAVNTFALGDIHATDDNTKESVWDFHSQWLQAIYQTYFGVTPVIRLTGPGAAYVMPDYRLCRNGSILVSLLNEGTNSASVTVTAPSLLQGKTVENLTQGGIVARPSNGVLTLDMQGDDYILLYAFEEGSSRSSLIQSSPYRVWFESAPVIVHPRAASYPVSVGFDTQGGALPLALSFESADGRVLSRSVPATVTGKDQKQSEISIPDADPNDPTYVSTPDGGSYFLHAILGGASGTESRVPVRLAWAVRPTNALPATPLAGQTYTIPLEWQELPSLDPNDPTPFDRALLWDSIDVTNHAYAVILNLVAPQGTVASNQVVTRLGNGSANLGITVPLAAGGPLQWSAEVRPVTLQSHDVWESFEGRDRGAMWPSNLNTSYVAPWQSFKYPDTNATIDLWQNEGVQLSGSDGSQSAFLVITNPPGLDFSGFGFAYPFPNGPWALPANRQEWTNWFFSFDFREDHGYPCQIQMQIKNLEPNPPSGKWLQITVPYTPGTNGWGRIEASLADFQPTPGLPGIFDSDHVDQIVIAALMEQSLVQYVGSFDNIRFDGPDQVLAFGAPIGSYGSANDSSGFLKVELVPTNQVRISWTGNGNLESAEQVKGPWTAVFRALSPLEIPLPPGQRFYRLAR
ncbi:MAG TPA: hypothetical protein VGR78_14750, partial [Verrucomicrobiae bacterium]|nr:hypothetical protein [Verrucomicrobiae bacterium]